MSIKSKLKFLNYKIKKVKTEVKKQEFYDNFSRMILPEDIIEYPFNLLINNEVLVHSIVCGIPPIGTHHDGYPRNLKDNIIDILTDIDAGESIISMSQTLMPVGRVKTGTIIQDAVVNNDMKSIWDKQEKDTSSPDLILKYSAMDLEANFKTHHEANQNMFDSIFIIVIFSLSEKDMRIAKGKVIQKLDANMIMHESPVREQMKAFMMAMGMPTTLNQSEAYRIQMFSRVAAVLTTLRVQNDSMDNDGIYYGDLIKTNKNLLINLDDLPAKHKLIFGSTGSGKTVGLLTWCLRAHDMQNYRIVYMTDKADGKTDYRNIVKAYGDKGQIIDIGPGIDETTGNKRENINPMQIFYEPDKMGNAIFSYEQAYDSHKGTLKAMMNAWKKDGLTTRQEAVLDMCIDNCYEKKGVFRSLPDTWSENWPLMEDLINEFKEDETNEKKKDPSLQALLDMSYPLGPKGELNYLNQPTTIKFDKSFMVIDLSSVPDSFKKAQNVLVTGIIAMRFKTDNDRTTIIAVDEAGSLMRDPKTTAFLLTINTKGRSANIGLWLGTQQPQDIIKAGIWEQMGNNMFVVCLFGRKSTSKGISALAQHFSLDEDAQQKLQSCDVGECIIMVEGSVYHAKVKLSPFEENILLNSKQIKVEQNNVITKINPEVYKLSIEHGVFFKDMIEGNPQDIIIGREFEKRRLQDAVGRGQMYYYINSALISVNENNNEMIGAQSLDHYVTVVRIASVLADNNIKVKINHHTDVDVVAEINGKSIAFEYERPGSHSKNKILEKNIHGLKNYDSLYFVTTSLNYDDIVDNIDEEFVVKRGVQLEELIKELLDDTTINSQNDENIQA